MSNAQHGPGSLEINPIMYGGGWTTSDKNPVVVISDGKIKDKLLFQINSVDPVGEGDSSGASFTLMIDGGEHLVGLQGRSGVIVEGKAIAIRQDRGTNGKGLGAWKATRSMNAPLQTGWTNRFPPGSDSVLLHAFTSEHDALITFQKATSGTPGSPGTLLAKLSATREVEPLTEELYLAVLARRPTPEETAEVKTLLDSARTPAERKELLQATMWGLLLSAEFRLNH